MAEPRSSLGRELLDRMKLSPGGALLPLRLFLGGTFVYAGVQKLSDPGFLHPGAPTYIGGQLRAFSHGTPGGFLLRALAIPHPALAGVGVALLEILVGLLILSGLLTRAAAAAGLALNLILFLTNSWHTAPYFLGSDIVFVFAWLPFVLAGASGQPAVDHALDGWTAAGVPWSEMRPKPHRAGRPMEGSNRLTRRAVLGRALGMTGLGTLVIAGASALAKGRYRSGTSALGSRHGAGPSQKVGGRGAGTSSSRGQSSVPSGAVRLGPSNRLATGQGATYPDPASGQPDIVVRDSAGGLTAFSAVCTHAGCTVEYQGGKLFCPCHGGVYNARTGAVESGPPPQGLARRRVIEHGGEIYGVPG
ncbi:MAG: TQO small subunit DoxD [Thermoleophilaceae bacterium]